MTSGLPNTTVVQPHPMYSDSPSPHIQPRLRSRQGFVQHLPRILGFDATCCSCPRTILQEFDDDDSDTDSEDFPAEEEGAPSPSAPSSIPISSSG
eukprot:CAMPEP_0206623076 /NCGR_PEP_ID=MMETSP0325_2-20121206/63197_1 /ASSEMBLY_ACC=CAM_ASM_000347 /TAXON_ID=2866 /ORGANISM="Crypthecodinium cohnii, Strain Seligo" /LENGTH=94 /DNA_ID=CAMNT_0054146545 /DNA_START=33 /DNA_END=313 /DNA_ORIENTATION=+